MNWKNLKLGKKLGVGFGILVLITAAIGCLSWYSLHSLQGRVEKADVANSLVKGYKKNVDRWVKLYGTELVKQDPNRRRGAFQTGRRAADVCRAVCDLDRLAALCPPTQSGGFFCKTWNY